MEGVKCCLIVRESYNRTAVWLELNQPNERMALTISVTPVDKSGNKNVSLNRQYLIISG